MKNGKSDCRVSEKRLSHNLGHLAYSQNDLRERQGGSLDPSRVSNRCYSDSLRHMFQGFKGQVGDTQIHLEAGNWPWCPSELCVKLEHPMYHHTFQYTSDFVVARGQPRLFFPPSTLIQLRVYILFSIFYLFSTPFSKVNASFFFNC